MNFNSNMLLKRILVVTAVSVEQDAVRRGLQKDERFNVLVGGVGPIATAANTAKVLATHPFDLVISAGIGGGFVGKAPVGSLVVANKIIAADLGVETAEGFCSLDQLGFGNICIDISASLTERVTKAFSDANLPVCQGPVLTVSTVTGTVESTLEMISRVPDAASEAMEGYGVAVAAQAYNIPILEIRAISNLVGPRDREAWRIKDALQVLEKASVVLSEVL